MKFKTCVSIAANKPSELEKALSEALKKSEYVEIRLDFFEPKDIPCVLEKIKKKMNRIVCTLRPRSEGGRFPGSEKERISILKLIAEYNPYLLDIEYKTLQKNSNLVRYLRKAKSNVLVSWHDFKKTPNEKTIKQMMNKMMKFSKYVKIVTTARSVDDTARILGMYSHVKKQKLIAFAMGDLGKMSRILCLYLGSPYTYVSLGKAIAPGQFSVDEIKKIISIETDF